MFPSAVKTDDQNEDGIGDYFPDFKCRVVHCLTAMSYSLASLANVHHIGQGSGED